MSDANGLIPMYEEQIIERASGKVIEIKRFSNKQAYEGYQYYLASGNFNYEDYYSKATIIEYKKVTQ